MTKPEKLFLCFIFCFLNQNVFGQDLRIATINYFINPHFDFDNNTISKMNAKLIEKHQYIYNNDSVISDFLVEKHQFNRNGNPEYVYKKTIGNDKSEIYFQYNTDGNLIKKEIYGISPQLNYKKIESFEWKYDDGFLVRQRRYLMADEIPTDKGGYGFPEMTFLFTNDSIVYNNTDTFILIGSNNAEQCKDVSASLYPPNFNHVINTTLKFHSNNKLFSKTVKRDSIIQSYNFDACGNAVNQIKPTALCLSRMANKTECLPAQKIRICNEADTATINNQLVYLIRSEGSRYQYDSGPGTTIINKGIAYYNQDFAVIHSIDTTTYIRGSLLDANRFTESKNVSIKTFEYFENGLLKKEITKNENGKLVEFVEYKIEYYE